MDSKEFYQIDYNTPIDDSQFKSVTSEDIVTKDLEAVSSCDIFLINLLHLKTKKMIGSLLEMGYAYSLGKPIISLYLPSAHKDHPFLKEIIKKNFDNIKSLVDFIHDCKPTTKN